MARKDNIKALFSNTKTRVIFIFTGVLIVLAVIVGIYQFSSSTSDQIETSAQVKGAPGTIQSIPGQINPTAQYAKLQSQQNVEQAQKAQQTGSSAIPTIIRTQAFGEGVDVIGPKQGEGGVGFTTLAREDMGGAQRSLWMQSLKDANCTKASINKVTGQGATLRDLRQACSCTQLNNAGISFSELKNICPCKELKAAGFNAQQLKQAGLSAGELRACGFSGCELRGAGFSAQEMLDGGFSRDELRGAGFPEHEIDNAGGLPVGVSVTDVRNAGCNADALRKLKNQGVSAAAIRRITGCSAAQLKAGGFSAADLKNAGFSAAELKNVGFTPEQLKQGGYAARDLLNAGFSPDELNKAGFSSSEIQDAEAGLPPGVSPAMVKAQGCDPGAIRKQRLAGVSALAISQIAGCSASALKQGGFTDADLANAGFTPQAIKTAGAYVDDNTIREAGCDPEKIRQLQVQGVSAKRIKDLNGCSAQALRSAGYDVNALTDAGFTPTELSSAGFSADEIKNALATVGDEALKAAGCDPAKLKELATKGVSAKRIREINGCSIANLKQAGFGAKELAEAGFDPKSLKDAGFTEEQINAAQGASANVANIADAGCDPNKLKSLKARGVSAREIREQSRCSIEDLKSAGFDSKELSDAGFSPQEILASGFTPADLTRAGLNPLGVIAAGRTADCSVASLKAARELGTSAATIKDTLGCPPEALREAGYSANDLKNAGFTAAELKDAGFSLDDLKAAGFGARDLISAGYSPQELKNSGFSLQALKDAGLNPNDLKNAGFSLQDLKAAGFSANELKNAGMSAEDLKKAGFQARELKDAGFGSAQLKDAGYSNQEIQDAGFAPETSAIAGLTQTKAPAAKPSQVAPIPGVAALTPQQIQAQANTQQLQEILKRQQAQMADQKSQQKLQQRTQIMQNYANQSVNAWKVSPTQVYIASSVKGEESESTLVSAKANAAGLMTTKEEAVVKGGGALVVKTGDIMFAVLDTSINSDEPGPILATIVSGKLKGSKLIGSFNLPSNADKMIISFNTLSMPGAQRTISVGAYAIDPNTARTALSSFTNHHYLQRYGSLFAATFLEGFGNAFQSANTTITIGGTGGVTDTTIENGVGRSILENAVIGLATLGKAWGQVAQQQFNRPTTVEVCAGTGIGVLFTQDVSIG